MSLRDGYQEFEAEVLARDRNLRDRVATARDAGELGNVLLSTAAKRKRRASCEDLHGT
ncbi:MAG: hypothetical protein WKG00_40730 [Polyangiaceae bacterium]